MKLLATIALGLAVATFSTSTWAQEPETCSFELIGGTLTAEWFSP
jgi:hypothetical protein